MKVRPGRTIFTSSPGTMKWSWASVGRSPSRWQTLVLFLTNTTSTTLTLTPRDMRAKLEWARSRWRFFQVVERELCIPRRSTAELLPPSVPGLARQASLSRVDAIPSNGARASRPENILYGVTPPGSPSSSPAGGSKSPLAHTCLTAAVGRQNVPLALHAATPPACRPFPGRGGGLWVCRL